MSALFVGGPADGRREAFMQLDPVRIIREMPRLPELNPWDEVPTTLECKNHHYLLRQVGSDAYVYLHESIHPSQLVYKLLAGYNPKSV
jgi:hypothetical protein